MWYVYIIRSINFPDQEYVGATEDLKRRVPEHNAGKSAHTSKFKPWQLVWYCAFPDKYKALAFEKYLKSHPAAPSPRSASDHPPFPDIAQHDDLIPRANSSPIHGIRPAC